MTSWRLDEQSFTEDVLKPVQQGWRPDSDLFRVYQLNRATTDGAVVDAALAGVLAALGKPKYRAFARACERIRSRHAEAVAVLADPARRAAHAKAVAAEHDRLVARLRRRLDGAPGMTATAVAAMVRGSDGTLTKNAVRSALAALKASEREPVALPATAEPVRWSVVRAELPEVGADTVTDYLSRFSGEKTSKAQLEERRKVLRKARNAAVTAETTLLKLIEAWLDEPGLPQVLRYEAIEGLGQRADYGYADLRAAAARSAGRHGLPGDADELAYAVWCAGAETTGEPQWTVEYTEAVRNRRLRDAERILDAQATLTEDWRLRRDRLRAQLARLDADLASAKALEATDSEAAATTYLLVAAESADPRIAGGLARCEPAAPERAVARVSGDEVVVSWDASTAVAGTITYRVLRTAGGPSETVADAVAGLDTVDADPPSGTDVVYTVITCRDAVPAGREARTAAVSLLRAPAGVTADARADAVTLAWTLPAGATGAQVTRSGRPLPDVGRTGVTDKDVRSGRTYGYRVVAEYRAGRTSGEVAITVTCPRQPDPVADLRAEVDAEGVLLAWTPPPHGAVEIRRMAADEPPPRTRVTTVEQARRIGQALSGSAADSAGELRLPRSAGVRRQLLVPVTVLGDLAAVGQGVEVDGRRQTVRGLRADRMASVVWLRWEWPPGVPLVRIVWRAGTRPTGPEDPLADNRDVSQIEYGSGVRVATEVAGEHWFGVCTLTSDDGEALYGPLAYCRETSTTEIRYAVTKNLFGRHTLAFPDPGPVPEVVLVARSGRRPTSPDDGTELVRLPAGRGPVSAKFDVPRDLARPVHLRAFPVAPDVALVPTQVHNLVVR